MLRPTHAAVALVLVLTVGAATPGSATGPSSRHDSELRAALAALVSKRDGPPGIVVVVQRERSRRVLTAGVADLETGRRIRPDDHMRVASVAKAYTGGVAVALVREGRLSLDDTVGKRRPDLPAVWADITLGQLMQHTSGIPDFSKEKAFLDALFKSPLDPPPPVQLLGLIADPTPRFDPGTQYEYSNSDNIIVALMAEAATGRPFASLLRSRVRARLLLIRTRLPEDERLPRPKIHGYDLSDPSRPEDVSEVFAAGWTFSAGGVISTPKT